MRRILLLSFAILLCATVASAQVPSIQTPFVKILGNPLTIHVGADNSFQVFNADVPGAGQIYPSDCENVADMGVFAEINGRLFAPDFANHGCLTATQNLGQFEPWTSVGPISPVVGNGTFESPFTVAVTTAAGNTGFRMFMTVQYVNGQNFFRISKRLIAFQTLSVRLWLAADIFLASSDFGLFHLEPTLNAPGGLDCEEATSYTILLIPVTAAEKFTAAEYQNVWTQIGAADLDNQVATGDCLDNGAALQWDRAVEPNIPVTIRSAVSFGTIPDPENFARFSISGSPNEFFADPGDVLVTTLTTARHDEGFNSALELTADNLPAGFTVKLSPSSIGAPGTGTATAEIQVGADVLPGTYIINIAATGEGERRSGAIIVHVTCDPPFVLGSDDLEDVEVERGSTAELTIHPSGSGPYRIQWFRGPSGSTHFPIEGATSATLNLPNVLAPAYVWARVSNSCGTFDSRTVLIRPR